MMGRIAIIKRVWNSDIIGDGLFMGEKVTVLTEGTDSSWKGDPSWVILGSESQDRYLYHAHSGKPGGFAGEVG